MIKRTTKVVCNRCCRGENFDQDRWRDSRTYIRETKTMFVDVLIPEGFGHEDFHICRGCRPDYIKAFKATKEIWDEFRIKENEDAKEV